MDQRQDKKKIHKTTQRRKQRNENKKLKQKQKKAAVCDILEDNDAIEGTRKTKLKNMFSVVERANKRVSRIEGDATREYDYEGQVENSRRAKISLQRFIAKTTW